MNRAATWLGFLCCAACSGTPLRGGYARPDAPRLDCRTVQRFVPGHCEDASHREHTPRFSSLELLETKTGRLLLLEHRQGHELLVAENFHDQGSSLRFEVIVHGSLLRRWNIPRSPGETGSLEVSRDFRETHRGDHFIGQLGRADLSCTLVPQTTYLPLTASHAPR